MLINVGTHNKIKVLAVRGVLRNYPEVVGKQFEVQMVKVPSDISAQPLSLEETSQGAHNRAKNAFLGCGLSVGIESGLKALPHTLSLMNFTVVAIYDGERYYIGHSAGFVLPEKLTRALDTCLEIDEAVKAIGLSDVPNIGKEDGGLLGLLTKGRVSRKAYTEQAIQMAMIHLENKELYA